MGKAFDFTPACLSFLSLWSFTLIFSPLSHRDFSCLTLRWKKRKRRTKIRVEPVHLVSLLNYTVSCSCFFSCSFIVFGLFTQPGKEQSDEKERRKKCEGETLWRHQRMEREIEQCTRKGEERRQITKLQSMHVSSSSILSSLLLLSFVLTSMQTLSLSG